MLTPDYGGRISVMRRDIEQLQNKVRTLEKKIALYDEVFKTTLSNTITKNKKRKTP